MSINIDVICYKYTTLKNGESPLKLRITKDRKRKYANLGVSLNLIHWDFDKNQPKPTCSNSKKNNQANLNKICGYNVRLWTSKIISYHFNEILAYIYNSNISSVQWGQAGKTRKYTFTYDNLSRLKTAAYTGESPSNFAASYTYYKHDNMLTLQRYGLTITSM